MFLTILLPSRNRPHKLFKLVNNLCNLISSDFQIIIIESLTKTFDDNQFDKLNIKYFYTQKDISFAEKIKFLLKKADSDYVWIISDDDEYNLDALKLILSNWFINLVKVKNVDLIDVNVAQNFLTIEFPKIIQRENVFNSLLDHKLPFTLISSFIFRNNLIMKEIEFKENIWIQNEVLMRYIGLNPSCGKLNFTTIKYIEPEEGFFTPKIGYEDFVSQLENFKSVIDNKVFNKSIKLQYINCQKTILKSLLGKFKIPNFNENLKYFRVIRYLDVKSISYSVLLCFPRITTLLLKLLKLK
jgi:hypothetical protein